MRATIADRDTFMYTSTAPDSVSPVNDLYTRIVALTADMLAAAIAQQWNDVLALGNRYEETVGLLKSQTDSTPLSSSERHTRVHLLSQILENDARIRALAIPELARVSDMLSRFHQQKSMLRTYRQTAGQTMS